MCCVTSTVTRLAEEPRGSRYGKSVTDRKILPALYWLATFLLNIQGLKLSTSKGISLPIAAETTSLLNSSVQLSTGCFSAWFGLAQSLVKGTWCSVTYVEITDQDLVS